MKVRDVMTREISVIIPDSTITEAAQKMRRLDVGMLPVYNGEQTLGIVTDRDIVVRSIAEGADPNKNTVKDIMTGAVESCFDDENIEDAAKQMEERQVRRLLVMDHSDSLVGVLSLSDMAARGEKTLACDVFDRIVESA